MTQGTSPHPKYMAEHHDTNWRHLRIFSAWITGYKNLHQCTLFGSTEARGNIRLNPQRIPLDRLHSGDLICVPVPTSKTRKLPTNYLFRSANSSKLHLLVFPNEIVCVPLGSLLTKWGQNFLWWDQRIVWGKEEELSGCINQLARKCTDHHQHKIKAMELIRMGTHQLSWVVHNMYMEMSLYSAATGFCHFFFIVFVVIAS